jgi:hypothetical protein
MYLDPTPIAWERRAASAGLVLPALRIGSPAGAMLLAVVVGIAILDAATTITTIGSAFAVL